MDNKNSKAGHVPIRTCVICRTKAEQTAMLNFFLLQDEIVFDLKRAVPVRKNYVCYKANCLQKLDKWAARRTKKTAARSKA
jgi:predicted RNA-binding protein YlxR (DUF448 family)